MATVQVSDKEFEALVLQADRPVLVDFWAEWCGPCKMIAPSLETLSEEFSERLSIAKVNIEENPQAPTRYGVRAIPTLLLFKKGEVAATLQGAMPKSQIQSWLEANL